MVVILDDSPQRLRAFQSKIPSAFLSETAAGIISLIEKHQPVDQLFLDHDLSNEIYVDSSLPNTGMEVVRWIIAHKPIIHEIIIHTHNFPASLKMQADLENAGYDARRIPYSQLISLI